MFALAACHRAVLSPAHWYLGPPGEETGEGKTWPLLPHRRLKSLSHNDLYNILLMVVW